MKHESTAKIAGRRASFIATFFIAGIASQSTRAADISMTATNAAGTSGFNSGTGWPGSVAPTAGNNYFTGNFFLRTPNPTASGSNYLFAGDSLSIDAGGRLLGKIGNNVVGNSTSATITVSNLILNGGTLDQAGSSFDNSALTIAGAITVNANSFIGALGAAANSSSSFETLDVTAAIGGSGGLSIAGSQNSGASTGVVKLSAANTYSGTITVATPGSGFVASSTNRLLQLNHRNALQSATLNLTSVANGVSFASAANTGAFNIGALSGTSGQALTDTGGAAVALNVGGNNTSTGYSGVLSGSGSLAKSGGGTLTLAGVNTYTGTTTVTAGLLSNGINNALAISTEVTVSGGTYDLAGFDQTVASLSDGGTSLGTVTNSGVLKTLTLNGGIDTTFSGEISGTLALTYLSSGKLTLPDANSYTGTTRLASGTLSIGNDAALGTGLLNFAGGAIESSSVTARTITNPINFEGVGLNTIFKGTGNLTFTATPPANGTDKTFTVENPQTELAGVLGGPGARTKAGSGLLIFSGLNTYTGTTTVNSGTLRIMNPVLSDTAAVVIGASGILDLPYGATDQVGSLTINGEVQANGIYGAIGSGAAHQVAAITGSGFLQVGGFLGFMNGFPGLTTAQKLPGADPDNDGISNLVEYALAGFDPTIGDPSPSTLVDGTLSFTKRALAVSNGDVNYAIESSTTLGLGSWSVVTPTVNDSSTISFLMPSGQPKEFARLRITQN